MTNRATAHGKQLEVKGACKTIKQSREFEKKKKTGEQQRCGK